MNKKIINSALKIFVGIVSCLVIALVVMNEFGIIDEIKSMQRINKVDKNNGTWKSEKIGKDKAYMEICDGEAGKEPDLAGVNIRSEKYQESSNIDMYVRLKQDMQDVTYEKIEISEPDENNIHSDNSYYYCFVPKDCDYITVGKKRINIQDGKRHELGSVVGGGTQTGNTRVQPPSGAAKFRMAMFSGGKYRSDYDVRDAKKIRFYTKSGKIYQYSVYEGEGKWL